MNVICDYNDWCIYSENSILFYYSREDNETYTAREVKRIEDFNDYSLEELFNKCNNYDVCGELDDGSAYCYWKLMRQVDNKEGIL